ncbi:SemD/SinC family type III secretion system effector [Chlamydia vaughanii]|uniref:SemD/SinC family type III secretion system effector n=1 Tax=Chlamydia vaughanii TaxID=3112552 RepID=UPI0032B26E1D
MGINPSGRGRNNDLWISGAHNQGEGAEGAEGPSGALGSHRVSTQSNSSSSQGLLGRIGSAVRNFFANIFGGGEGSSSRRSSVSSESSTSSLSSRLSTESTGDARSTEGAAAAFIKKGYTPGKKVESPTVTPTSSPASSPGTARRIQRPSQPPPPPPSGPAPASSGAVPKRRAPQAPTGGAAGTSHAMGSGGTVAKRRAPQPPTGGASGSGGTISKRRAPLPPSGGSDPKLQRRGSITSISSTGSIDSVDSNIVDGLREALGSLNLQKEQQLSELSNQIKARWTDQENRNPVGYQLTGLRTLMTGLENARRHASSESNLVREGIDKSRLNEAKSSAQGLWALAAKEQKQDDESALLCILVQMGFGGSSLAPEVRMVDYVNDLIDMHTEEGAEGYEFAPQLQDLASRVDTVRTSAPGNMPSFWASFFGRGASVVRNIYNNAAANNSGRYDPAEVRSEAGWNASALQLMQQLNPGAYGMTMGVLASDMF